MTQHRRNQVTGLQHPLPATVFLIALLLGACSPEPPVRFFAADAYPVKLSEWGIIRMQGNRLTLADDVHPYDINTPLFTDYASKLRTIYLPPGTSANYSDHESFRFPVGTIISKSFFYPRSAGVLQASYEWSPGQRSLDTSRVEVLETRLLVRQADGWDALPYVWEGDDAVLKIAGTLNRLSIELDNGAVTALPYIVPTRNECAACHATDHSSGDLQLIGLKARHLNRSYLGHGDNQLTAMTDSGRLSGLPALENVPRNADQHDTGRLTARARAYLDANCGHCHNPKGAADTSGLMLDAATTSTRAMGICKPPIAAGQGTGGFKYSIIPGAPDQSILLFRMATDDPGSRMPELGRSLVHSEGVALIGEWIRDLEGECIENAAGVETLPDWRQRGHALLAVQGWAAGEDRSPRH